MLKIGSEDFVIMKHIQHKTGVNEKKDNKQCLPDTPTVNKEN